MTLEKYLMNRVTKEEILDKYKNADDFVYKQLHYILTYHPFNEIHEYENGDIYVGTTWNKQRHGYGCYIYVSTKNVYLGEWKENAKNGFGTLYGEKEIVHSGEWLNSIAHKFGGTYKNGELYVGTYKYGLMHGVGILNTKNSFHFCLFKSNKKKVLISISNYMDINFFIYENNKVILKKNFCELFPIFMSNEKLPNCLQKKIFQTICGLNKSITKFGKQWKKKKKRQKKKEQGEERRTDIIIKKKAGGEKYFRNDLSFTPKSEEFDDSKETEEEEEGEEEEEEEKEKEEKEEEAKEKEVEKKRKKRKDRIEKKERKERKEEKYFYFFNGNSSVKDNLHSVTEKENSELYSDVSSSSEDNNFLSKNKKRKKQKQKKQSMNTLSKCTKKRFLYRSETSSNCDTCINLSLEEKMNYSKLRCSNSSYKIKKKKISGRIKLPFHILERKNEQGSTFIKIRKKGRKTKRYKVKYYKLYICDFYKIHKKIQSLNKYFRNCAKMSINQRTKRINHRRKTYNMNRKRLKRKKKKIIQYNHFFNYLKKMNKKKKIQCIYDWEKCHILTLLYIFNLDQYISTFNQHNIKGFHFFILKREMLKTLGVNNNEHLFFLLNFVNLFNSIQNIYIQMVIKWKSIKKDSLLLYNTINKNDIFIMKQIRKSPNLYLASYRNAPVCVKIVSRVKRKQRKKLEEGNDVKKEKDSEDKQKGHNEKVQHRVVEKKSLCVNNKVGSVFVNTSEVGTKKMIINEINTKMINRKYLEKNVSETDRVARTEKNEKKEEEKEKEENTDMEKSATTPASNLKNTIQEKSQKLKFFNEKLNIFNANFMGSFINDFKKNVEKKVEIKKDENENDNCVIYTGHTKTDINRHEEWVVHSNKAKRKERKERKEKRKEIFLKDKREMKKNENVAKQKKGETITVDKKKTDKRRNIADYDASDFLKKIKCRINFVKEYFILSNVRHPTIIKYIGNVINKKKEKFGLVLEYVKGYFLYDYIYKYKQILNKKKIIKILYEISASLNYLHQRNICHGNIQSKNILITKTDAVKICNFQNAFIENFYDYKIKSKKKDSTATPFCEHWNLPFPYLTFVNGAKNINSVSPVLQINANRCNLEKQTNHTVYTAPEVIRKEGYTFKSDIYSFGIIMYELLFNTLPFSTECVPLFFLMSLCSHQKYIYFDMNKLNDKFDSSMFHLSINFILLIKQCLHPIPDNRPNSKYLCEHFKDMLDMLDMLNLSKRKLTMENNTHT